MQEEELPLTSRIPDWVLDSNLSSAERYAWSVGDGAYVRRETEKAVLIGNKTDFGEVTVWVPKSVIMTSEQVRTNVARRNERFQKGIERHAKLVELAESSGVKGVRKNMRGETLVKKLRKAGVEVPADLLPSSMRN